MTLLTDSDATDGKLSAHLTTLSNGADGASPHRHRVVAEVFYVLRGNIQLLIGEELIEAGAGDLAVIPPGVAHAFAAAPGSEAELLVAVTPGIERFSLFRQFERVSAGREPAGTLADQSHYDTFPYTSEIWEKARQIAATTKETPMIEAPHTTRTEHRTMNTVIHAALRRDLQRLDDTLEGFPAGSRSRADQLAAVWNNVAHQLHLHHRDEETLFWPAFQQLGVEQSLITELEAEHAQMVAALATAETTMEHFVRNPTASNVAAARSAIAALYRVLDDHLAHEERDLEPFGASHKESPQHKAAVARARKSHTEGAGTFFAWLSDTDDPAIATALRQEVPAPVLFLLTRVGGRRYNRRSAAAWG